MKDERRLEQVGQLAYRRWNDQAKMVLVDKRQSDFSKASRQQAQQRYHEFELLRYLAEPRNNLAGIKSASSWGQQSHSRMALRGSNLKVVVFCPATGELSRRMWTSSLLRTSV